MRERDGTKVQLAAARRGSSIEASAMPPRGNVHRRLAELISHRNAPMDAPTKMDPSTKLSKSNELAGKISLLFQKRLKVAQTHYASRMDEAYKRYGPDVAAAGKQEKPT